MCAKFIDYYCRMSTTSKIKLSTGKGDFYAVVDNKDVKRVQEAGPWFFHKTGYAYTKVTRFDKKRITVYLHRFIVGLKYGDAWQVDHMDGNKLNNSKENLRIVTQSENNQNKGSLGGSSEYRGVHKKGNKWIASVSIPQGKRIRQSFDNEIDAAIWAHIVREKKVPYYVPDQKILTVINDYQDLKNSLAKSWQKSYA